MNRRRFLPPLVSCCVMALLCACGTEPPPSQGYTGETLPLEKVVEGINQNNQKIPTLWARQDFEANVVDPKNKKSHFVNGYGNLLYTGPDKFRLVGKKEVTDLFDMGTDGENFWFRLIPEQDTLWWGKLTDLNGADAAQVPIRPDLILEVLGILPVNNSLLEEPAPVMRFSNSLDAYMIVWQSHSSDRWIAQKEIWYDRATLHAERVVLFDENGRVVLNAILSKYQPIEADPLPRDQWPSVATHFDLFFPDTGSKMSFGLSDLTLSHNGFPKPATYRMPDAAKLGASGVTINQIGRGAP